MHRRLAGTHIVLALCSRVAWCSSDCGRSGIDIGLDSRTIGSALLQTKRDIRHDTNSTVKHGDPFSVGLLKKFDYGGVLVIVPGLGSEERVGTVERNVNWLQRQQVPFDCLIYVYPSEDEFPLDATRFEPCQLIRHPGHWLSHMQAVDLELFPQYKWVVHMEDGIEPQEDVNIKTMQQIMVANRLGHAAPTFDMVKNPNDYIMQQYPALARQEEKRTGRFVDFIEFHFDILTRDYFACMQQNIDNSDEDMLIGWGMDRLLPALCGGDVDSAEAKSGRLGVLDQMTMIKRHYGSYSHDAAQRGMDIFYSKHPNASGPTFATLGDLVAPSEAGN